MLKIDKSFARASAAGVLALLAACSSPSTSGSQTSAGTSAVYPDGIVPFKTRGDAVRAGLYPSNATAGCCFLGPRASVRLAKPAGKVAATLHFYVPKVAPYAGGESVTVTAAGKKASGINAGTRWIAVTLTLPNQLKNATSVPVEIVSSKSFVPSKLGMNGDTRELSVVLSKVDFP
jgi:hypothetical protein